MIIDDEFYMGLPEDPEEAFGIFESHLNAELGEPNQNDAYVEREYTQHVVAYCLEYGIDIGTRLEQGESEGLEAFYWRLRGLAGLVAKRSNLKRLRRLKSGSYGVYLLSPAQKVEIRHYIDRIRELLDKVDLTAEKRRELVKRLNAFAAAVELDRTQVQALNSMYVFAKREAKEASDSIKEEIKPVIDVIEKINGVIEKASEYLGLPKSEGRKELPSPPKKLEGPVKKTETHPELDDDIPF